MIDRRAALLAHNAGIWEGTFVRLDGEGREQERFASHLEVSEQEGTIEAALTNGSSGNVRRMSFREPPAEMQIAAAGHWSLGPDRIGPWPWISELCLVHGERRRRVVLRHGSESLESLVVVCEGRPERREPAPPAPLQLEPQYGAEAPGQQLWKPEAGREIETIARRQPGSPQRLALRWSPEPGLRLELVRGHDAYGLLQPL